VTVFCEHGNERPVSIKGLEFLEKLSECYLLKKNCAARSQSVCLLVG
jgi:hypothetical protein